MTIDTANQLESVDNHIGGDTVTLRFAVPDEDSTQEDAYKDLTSATISWALVDWDETIVLSDDDPGVSVSVSDPVNGKFAVQITDGAGEGLNGTFEEWVRIETEGGDRQTWVGEFIVVEGVLDE